MEIPEWPFNKIAIDLVTECEPSTSGNKHVLTIIDHLTGWLEAFPIPDKSAVTLVSTFINYYLPAHMCPRYILSDKITEFKNHLIDQVLQQLSMDGIFSTHYNPQSNGKLEVFHKYLKPTLKKLLELMQWFLGDPESGLLNLEAHHLALAIAKKTVDENCFRTMDRELPSFKIGKMSLL